MTYLPRAGLGALIAACVAAALGLAGCGGKSTPPSAAVTLAAALKLQQEGKTDAAAQLYQQVLAKDPKSFVARYDLGVIAQASGNSTAALTDYAQALTINPSFIPALYNQAVIFTDTDAELAISTYRKIIKLDRSQSSSQLNLGRLEVENGQVAAGVHNLAIAIKEDPTLVSHVPPNVLTRVNKAAAHVTVPASPQPTTSAS